MVILGAVKTAISVPNPIFERVEEASARLGMSRSEFYARAAARWLDELEDDGTTSAIDRTLADASDDTAFVEEAARRSLRRTEWR